MQRLATPPMLVRIQPQPPIFTDERSLSVLRRQSANQRKRTFRIFIYLLFREVPDPSKHEHV